MNSLVARLMLIIALAVAPALGFQAFTESEARHAREQLVEAEALRLVRLISAEQARIAEGAEQVLNVISGAPFVQENPPGLCQRLLADLLEQSPRYVFAAVIGLDGHAVCAPRAVDRGIDASKRDYFRLALQTGGFAIGGYAVGNATGQPSIHMAKPLRNRDGLVVGVVAVALSLDWLGQQLEHLALPPGAAVSIIDRSGTVLAGYPDGAGFVGRPVGAEYRFTLEGNVDKVVRITSREGRRMVVGYSPLDSDPKGWAVAVGLDRDLAFAGVATANRTGMLLIVAGAGFALAMTSLAGTRLIRRPLNRLLAVADRWRSGDLSARTGLPADSSEFGRLGAAFDAMAVARECREGALHTALESTTDSVMVIDRAWRISYLNGNAKAQVGRGRELVGLGFWEAFPATAGNVFGDAFRAAMEHGVPTRAAGYSIPFQRHFDAHAYPSKDGLTVFFRDVTDGRRAAAALRRSEEQFRATFEQAAVGMALVGLDGTWLRVNDKACSITGYARDEMLARRFQDLTHPDDLETDLAVRQRLLAGEIATFTREKRYLRKDGDIIWVNLTVSLIRDAEGMPESIISVIEDITGRRNVEAALRESETRLQLAREAARFGVWDRDLVTGEAVWSEQEWLLYGLDPRPGAPDRDIWRASLHPGDRQRVDAEMTAAFADSTCRLDTDYRVLWPDGTVHWLLAKAIVVRDAHGKAVRMVGLNLDVTAARESEAALRRLSTELEARVLEEVGAREAAQTRAAHNERMHALGALAGASRTTSTTFFRRWLARLR
jgi:PAS domain S-box-containing protein